MLSGAMISLWVGRWRSQVPSVNSPECVEGRFSEGRTEKVRSILRGVPVPYREEPLKGLARRFPDRNRIDGWVHTPMGKDASRYTHLSEG